MEDISLIVNNFLSLVDSFDHINSIYHCSLNNLHQFTNDNLALIESNHYVSTDNIKIVKVSTTYYAEDLNSIKKFYIKE
jgi:hypothetical protein